VDRNRGGLAIVYHSRRYLMLMNVSLCLDRWLVARSFLLFSLTILGIKIDLLFLRVTYLFCHE